MTDWIILRMSPGSTLAVAKGLVDAGYEAWTPIEKRAKHVGVGKARKRVQQELPMMPSFVFARDDRLADLVALSNAPAQTYQRWDAEQRRMVTHGLPVFRLFRYLDAYPRIADRHLDPLRQAEQRSTPRDKRTPIAAGTPVRCPDAGFDGLTGVVLTTRGRYALVAFPGFSIPVTIEPNRLLPARRAA